MNCDTYQDLVAAHVDDALSPMEAAEVEAHLLTCVQCQRLFEEESSFHAAFSARRLVVPVPIDVERRLHTALIARSEGKPSLWERVCAWFEVTPTLSRVAFGLVAVGILMTIVLPYVFRPVPTPDVFARAVHYYQAVTAGVIPLEYTAEDPQRLQGSFNTSGRLDFTTQVSDLQPAGYRLKGGSVTVEGGQPLAVALYEEAEEAPIVCLRQRGLLPPLPHRTTGANGHYWYTADGYAAMFTQFPDHFCIMISHQPEDSFRQRLAQIPAS